MNPYVTKYGQQQSCNLQPHHKVKNFILMGKIISPIMWGLVILKVFPILLLKQVQPKYIGEEMFI